MIEAPDGHYWEVHLGRWDITLVLWKIDMAHGGSSRVSMDSTPGVFSDEGTVEVVDKMAKKMLARCAKAETLSTVLGVEVIVK
jgi:hypothetical protein